MYCMYDRNGDILTDVSIIRQLQEPEDLEVGTDITYSR